MLKLAAILIAALIPWGALFYAPVNYYVRSGATGTACDDWRDTHACPNPPTAAALMSRGDTVYIADGSNYSGVIWNTAVSGTVINTVKKAIIADHGTSTGWLDSYGDGTAVFTDNFAITTGYWLIDGQTGGGPSTWNTAQATTGFGFEDSFLATVCGSTYYLQIGGGTPLNNVTVNHFLVDPTLSTCGASSCYPTETLYIASGGDSIHVENVAVVGGFGGMMHVAGLSNAMFENMYFANNRFTGAVDPYGKCNDAHGEGVSAVGSNATMTFRNNLWNNVKGTAVIAWTNVGTTDGLNIYGNLFINGTVPLLVGGPDAQVANMYFANNTIVYGATTGYQGGVYMPGQDSHTRNIVNNIWWNADANTFGLYGDDVTHNYASGLWNSNAVGCSMWSVITCNLNSDVAGFSGGQDAGNANPFVSVNLDPLIADFHLSANTSAGETLSSPLNVDAFGVTRGANGTWDMGAYQIPASGNATQSSGRMRRLR